MKYSILVTLDARVETQDAFYWYEDRSEGLGDAFYANLNTVTQNCESTLWHIVIWKTHRFCGT
jgi:hypothetical protein